jgi:hypothetical protein
MLKGSDYGITDGISEVSFKESLMGVYVSRTYWSARCGDLVVVKMGEVL